MSKKKEEAAAKATSDSKVNAIVDIVTKKYGKGIIKTAKEKFDTPNKIIDISPAHNLGIGGPGVPQGSWVVLAGPPKTCKTSTALHIAKKAQAKGMVVIYLNVEGRIKERDIKSMQGIDPEKVYVVESTDEKILMGVDFLNIAQDLLMNNVELFMIIDSFSALINKTEFEEGIGTQTRGSEQKNAWQFTRNMANVVPVRRHIVVCLNQIMANTGYGMATKVEKGGYGVKFQCDLKLATTYAKDIEVAGKIVGKDVTWEVETTPFNNPPSVKFQSIVRYGEGIDEISETLTMATDLGFITKASGGGWYSVGDKKFQGDEKLKQGMLENPELFESIKKQIDEILV